jgi:hypothetical protein
MSNVIHFFHSLSFWLEIESHNTCKFAGRPPGREDEIIRYRPNWKSSSSKSGSKVETAATLRTLVGCDFCSAEEFPNSWSWGSISVIDEPKIKNAFVLPTGQIFFFTGMLSLCDNDQQSGVILAHEMAHAVLAHGAELVISLFYWLGFTALEYCCW